MNDRDPSHKVFRPFQHKRQQRVALLILLAGILLLIVCLPDTSVEARYRLQDRIGFVVTIPSASN